MNGQHTTKACGKRAGLCVIEVCSSLFIFITLDRTKVLICPPATSQTLAAIILGQMRPLLVIFIGLCWTQAFSQNAILKNNEGHPTDTLYNNSLFFIKHDTLTRFLIGKVQTTDRCSSFSIIRQKYIKEQDGFHQLGTRTIVISNRCSNLLTADNVYCLRLVDFKIIKETVKIAIADSNDKKLRTKLKGDKDFEIQLKNKIDKFVSKVECNVVRIE